MGGSINIKKRDKGAILIKNQNKIGFTNKVAVFILVEDAIITGFVLLLCLFCVVRDYTGSLAFLTALIALQQVKSTTILSFITNKSRAENTTGGIIYDTAMQALKNGSEPDRDC